MTAEQEAIFNMFRDTLQVRSDNSVYVGTIPKMDTGFTDLKMRIDNISGLASLQSLVNTGISVSKEKLKDKMAFLQYNYAGPGRAWAAAGNDDTTYNSLDITKSAVIRARDDQAGPLCRNIHTILSANAPALIPYGLTAAMINELDTAINDYVAIVPLPSNAINIRQTYTTNIENLIRDTQQQFLERVLDNIVRGQINANADFVSTYFNAREIIDPPTQSTTFKITVMEDDGTGTGGTGGRGTRAIINAQVQAVDKGKFATTDADGKAELKQFPKGTYTILVSAEGYDPSQQVIPIGLGETKEITFFLKKRVV